MKQQVKISKVKGNPSNPRIIKNDKFKKLVKSIQEFPEMLKLRPIVVDEDMIVLGGNMRLKASKDAGLKEVWIEVAEGLTEEQKKEFIVKDNVGFGEWEWDILANEWDSVQLAEWGLDVWENEDDVKEEPTDLSENLKETFEVIITCDNEQEQEETFNYLTEKNYICRVLTL
jgi:ParB-like chromosome segregation protein Spo0J